MFVLTLIFYFKSKSKRNLFAKVPTKPEFLVTKKKMLVTLATILVAILSSAKAAFIMYTVGGRGAEDIFQMGKIFKDIPHIIHNFLQPSLLTKRKNWHSPPRPTQS